MFKKFLTIFTLLSAPLAAQATLDPVVRFVGVLGDLRLSAGYVRADLIELDNGSAQLAIAMNREAGFLFANFTNTHINQNTKLSICQMYQQDLKISQGITSGFVLTDALPSDVARILAAVINDEQACPNGPAG